MAVFVTDYTAEDTGGTLKKRLAEMIGKRVEIRLFPSSEFLSKIPDGSATTPVSADGAEVSGKDVSPEGCRSEPCDENDAICDAEVTVANFSSRCSVRPSK
jgi:hypothetical protein